jgi:hypothetical protein
MMSRFQTFEAKAEALERLSLEVPAFRQVYGELAKVWHRLARQALALEQPAT